MKEERKECGICEKSFGPLQLILHERMCQKMNYKCPMCFQIVLKCEKETHDEEYCPLVERGNI